MNDVHTGGIRTTGTAGDADRDLGDFFTCDVDEFGRMIVTFGVDGDDGPNARQSVVMFAKQLEGPFLLENTGPEAIFDNSTFELTVYVDATRSFDRNGGGIIEYQWDWGDGTNSTGILADHTYKKSGTYKITLKVINKVDMRDIATSLVTVKSVKEALRNIWFIVLPIGLIVIGAATFYYWYKKRRAKIVEVEPIQNAPEPNVAITDEPAN
jgi:PKD repeat protein